VGKGFKADEITTMLLDTIKGWGKDTFNTILENMIRTYHIGGDSFAEIIRDNEGNLINLKPLDPSIMKIVANRQGVIIRYEQISKVKKPDKKFKIEKILHLARNRVADEIHGVSMISNLEENILRRNEAMSDMRILMHRHVKPMRIWKLDTDNTAKISGFKSMVDKATEDAENIYIPQDAVEHEIVTVPANASLNPLPWIQLLNSQFFIEEQILGQLNILIELEFPASLENELLSDKAKDGAENIQPNETTAGAGQ
jgi:hypothetical protein